jgi:hypothetical protein
MPTIVPDSIESESVRAETLEIWPAEGGMFSGSVMAVVKTLVKTFVRIMAVIGTTTAKNPASKPFRGWCNLQFEAGSPQHTLCTWLLTRFKRKLPARRDVFSLDQQCSEIGTNSKIVVFFTGVQ